MKILKYKILWQLSMEVQDFFSLCKIYHPAWLQAGRRNVEQMEQCLSDLCITKLEKTPSELKPFFDKSCLGYKFIEPSTNQD